MKDEGGRTIVPRPSSIVYRLSYVISVFCFLFSVVYAQEQFTYNAKGKRDPFIPLVTPDGRLLKLESQETAALALEGIIYDKYGLSYAIVDGNVVKIGDKIGEYWVLKIEENKAVFIKDGEITEIKLKKEE